MPIRVQCPQCGKEYNVGDDKAGRRFQCKACQGAVVVPTATAAADADPFAGMDDFSEDYGSPQPRPAGAKKSSSAKGGGKGKGKQKGKSDSSGMPVGAWIGIGAAVAVAIAAGVFFMMRGGGEDDDAPAGGNNSIANTNDGNNTGGGNATPSPAGNTPVSNIPTGATGGATAHADQSAGQSAAELDATLRQLKDIVLGMHNYHDVFFSFPFPQNMSAAFGPDGKPFLSWRVHLLPFLDQQNLYQQFHLDEPWDSPNNLPLADLMPAIYRTPGGEADTTSTRFIIFTGPATIFDGGIGKGFRDIIDGSSNTILLAHAPADRAVPWTKPDDLPFDPADPLACIGGAIPPEGLPIAMADGACFFLSPEADATSFANYVQPADSQFVAGDFLSNKPANYVPFVPPNTPPAGPLHLAYMTDDTIGLIHISPKRLLEAEWIQSALPPDFVSDAPVPLESIEQTLVWISPHPEYLIPSEPNTQFALRFLQPISLDDMPLNQLPSDGRGYMHSDNTFVFARGNRFERMFTGSGAYSPLTPSLRPEQFDADVYLAFQLRSPAVDVDWSQIQPLLAFAGELGNGLMSAEQVQVAFRASESPLLKIWLTFPDDTEATSYKTALEQQLPQMLESLNADPIAGPLVTLLADAWSVDQEAGTVSMAIAHSDALTAEIASLFTALTAPAVMINREVTGREQTRNNLHEILLASHNYHDNHNTYPVPSAVPSYFDENGKPFLSWRVHLLPFLDEVELFQEFHFDEPWDSEHNIQLLERMPDLYQVADDYSAELEPGMTRIVRADGEGTPFPNGVGSNMSRFYDGTSNTAYCFVVGPEHAVPWTKPDDIVIDFTQPIWPQLGIPEGEDFLVGMADGATRNVPTTVDEDNLRRLLLRDDGEVLELP